MKIDGVCISTDNTKLGIIPNLSLPAIRTCIKNPPCAKSCYAIRLAARYPAPRKAYQNNLHILLSDSYRFFCAINKFISCYRPKYFRIHSSGDFNISKDNSINQDYLDQWMLIINQHPGIKFLAFTKCNQLNYSAAPKNFTVLYSAWFNYPIPELSPGIKGIAFVQDTKQSETRIPSRAIQCSGKCDSCFACWNIPQGGAVVLPLH